MRHGQNEAPPEFSRQTKGTPTHVVLSADLTIATAAALHAELQTVLARGNAIAIDGGGVERVDTAIVQLLWCFSQEARATRVPLYWTQTAAVLVAAAELLGLAAGMGWTGSTM